MLCFLRHTWSEGRKGMASDWLCEVTYRCVFVSKFCSWETPLPYFSMSFIHWWFSEMCTVLFCVHFSLSLPLSLSLSTHTHRVLGFFSFFKVWFSFSCKRFASFSSTSLWLVSVSPFRNSEPGCQLLTSLSLLIKLYWSFYQLRVSSSILVPLSPSAFFTVTTDSPSVSCLFVTLSIELPGFYIKLLNDTLFLELHAAKCHSYWASSFQRSIRSSYHV